MDLAELMQETFQEAVAEFDQFLGKSEGELFVWLRQIMKSKIVSLARHYQNVQKRDVRRQVSLDESFPEGALKDLIPDDDLTPYTSTNSAERRLFIQQAFEQLRPEQRQVIQLHHTDGKSFVEIAEILGKTPKTVAKIWERGLKAWRAGLASLGVEDT